METSRLQHPVLEITIGGTPVDKRPSAFTLITAQGFPSIFSKLRYPQDAIVGKTHDPVTVTLMVPGEQYLLFTGEIFSTGIHGAIRDLSLTDGYKKLCDTLVISAYRKETAKVILQDILEQAGITKTAITCPSVEMARFSTEKIPADACIALLIKALEEHGHHGLRYFFDEENTFRFGTESDTGKNEGAAYEFETGKNILKKGDGWIEVLPLPIRHSQAITVDGTRMLPFRTDLSVTARSSRLILWVKEAA